MRTALAVTLGTAVVVALLVWSWRAFGGASVGFAFLVVWLPMAWLGSLSRVVTPRLPAAVHRLRPWERSGRVHELLGVRVVKRMLRRGPMAVFNPGLRLPRDRTPDELARLDERMCDAEASHAILLVASLAVVAHAAARGWWSAAAWTLVFDLLVNGYPVLLQRYNRAILRRRFPGALAP